MTQAGTGPAWRDNQCIPAIPHAPGPPGTPHDAHGLSAGMLAPADDPGTLTANTDNCFSSCSPRHLGHDGATPARVSCSNR
jgi:hypothetical protein